MGRGPPRVKKVKGPSQELAEDLYFSTPSKPQSLCLTLLSFDTLLSKVWIIMSPHRIVVFQDSPEPLWICSKCQLHPSLVEIGLHVNSEHFVGRWRKVDLFNLNFKCQEYSLLFPRYLIMAVPFLLNFEIFKSCSLRYYLTLASEVL